MNAITSLLYVPNVCATKADGADKGSKLLKACLAVFKEMCASSAVLFPMPLVNLGTAIGQLNSVNTLFQIPFRYGEWSANKWGMNREKSWLGQSDGFKSKALLTAALVVEGVRILQANYVLPVTENLFAVMGKVPVFQTASKVINSFPAGSYLSNLVMKVSGLEMIKNILFISSSVYALKKACTDSCRAHGEYGVAIADMVAGEEDQKITAVARRDIARLDIEKSSRAYWKEVTKLTVLGTASAIVLGFIASPVLLTMFNTVTVATAAFNLWCVVKDVQAEDQRAEIRQQALAAARRDEDDNSSSDEEVGAASSSSTADVTDAVFSQKNDE